MTKNKANHYNDIDKVYLKIWDLLNYGLKNRDAPFHIPVFTTANNKNCDSRLVVLRGVDQKNKKLWFHSDIRSKKIEVLKKNPQGSLLFYDKNEKIQLRISVITKINNKNDISEKSWNRTVHMSRQCYLGENPPGTNSPIPTSGLSEKIENFKYTLEESEIGYKNFCVIESFITSIEWLYLAAKGHRRAYFVLKNDLVEKNWIIP